jgi:NAD(P)-dependent dehydrogenase (short-subunit alcohol dehydrogenase family)
VYIACRSQAAASEAMKRLAKEKLKGEVEFLELDLLEPASAKAAANKILKEEERLDILGACSPSRVSRN